MPTAAGAADSARRVAHDPRTRLAARIGLAAHGAVYLLLGVLALALAFGHRASSADQSGAVQTLARNPAGLVLLVVIAIGLACYALWQLFQAVTGHSSAGEQDERRDRALRGIRGVVNAGLAVLAFSTVTDRDAGSQSRSQQTWTARLMGEPAGRWLVALVGLVVVVVGVVLIVGGLRRSFDDEFDRHAMSAAAWRTTLALGVAGKTARGVVVGLVGVLLVTAAVRFDPKQARGVDGALRSLRDNPFGPWLLGLVALGLIAFGLYGFCEARWRRL